MVEEGRAVSSGSITYTGTPCLAGSNADIGRVT